MSAHSDDDARLDAWVDAHFDDEVRFLQALVRVPTDTPPGDNAPHAEATATLLEGFGFAVERHPVPDDARARARPRVDHQPGRSPPLRRRADDRPQRPRRRRPAGRRLAPRPVRRRSRRRQDLRPRRGGEQERLRDLHLRRARARIARRRLAGGVELHFTYDEEFGGELGPGRLLAQGVVKPDLLIAAGFSYQVVTAHNGCLQLEVTVHGKMAHAAIPATGVDALQGAVEILNALYAQNDALPRRDVAGRGHHASLPQRRHDRRRHQHQRRPRQGPSWCSVWRSPPAAPFVSRGAISRIWMSPVAGITGNPCRRCSRTRSPRSVHACASVPSSPSRWSPTSS